MLNSGLDQPEATLRHQEGVTSRCSVDAIPTARVALELLARSGVHWHQPRLARLAPANGEDASVQIDIASVQGEGFAMAHARDRQEPQQGRVRPGSQTGRRRERLGGADQVEQLVVRIDVGLGTPELAWQQIRRRHHGPGIGGAQVLGEAAYHAQSDRSLAPLHVRRERRPPESQIGRHPVRAFSLREVHESTERPLGSAQFEAECPTNREVLVQRSLEATHRPTPGHGGATVRNAWRSTLA